MIKNIIIIILLCLLFINFQRKLTYYSLTGALMYLLLKNGIVINLNDKKIKELQKEALFKITDFKTFFL